MGRDEAIRILRQPEGEIRAHGVTRLALFGSIARGEARPDSDIVVDVEPGHKFSLIDLASLRVFLCDIFGRDSDVVVCEDLRPGLRAAVDAEVVEVL
ncbi:MAG: nucleotidyltransferase family protein [Pseudomonadota bacterium]